MEAVALLAQDRWGPYLQLKLVLSDGATVFVEEGEERARMEERPPRQPRRLCF